MADMQGMKWGAIPMAAINGLSAAWDGANSTMKQELVDGVMVVAPANGKASKNTGSPQYKGDNVQLEFASLIVHGDWLLGQARNYSGVLFEYKITDDSYEDKKLLAVYAKGNKHLETIISELESDVVYNGAISFDPNGKDDSGLVNELEEDEGDSEKLFKRLFKITEVLTLEELQKLTAKLPAEVQEKKSSGGGYSKGGAAAEKEESKLKARESFLKEFTGSDDLLTAHADKLNLGLTIIFGKMFTVETKHVGVIERLAAKEEPPTPVLDVDGDADETFENFIDSLPARKQPTDERKAEITEAEKSLIYNISEAVDLSKSSTYTQFAVIDDVSKQTSIFNYTVEELEAINTSVNAI